VITHRDPIPEPGSALGRAFNGRQDTENAVAGDVLNRMLELGRPEYVRLT